MSMETLTKLAHVVAQLSTYAGEKKVLKDSTLVCCPYHADKTPSFRIYHSPASRNPGYGKCYGCGAARPWDEHAPKLGLLPWAYSKPSEVYASTLSVESAVSSPDTDDLDLSDLPKDKLWRGIKTNFLISVGARKCRQYGESFVYLPVLVMGQERGHVKARLRKVEGKPSYINSKGGWSASYGLFLYDHVANGKPKAVVLVEGPRDGLRLNYLGIPAISILGTQSWSERKSRMIELLGVSRVVLCMDGDDAGLQATAMIKEKLSPLVKVSIFPLTGKDSPYWRFRHEDHPTKAAKAAGVSLWDPGNMPMSKIKELKTLMKGLP